MYNIYEIVAKTTKYVQKGFLLPRINKMSLFHTFTVQIAKIHRSIQRIKTEEMKEFGLKGLHVSCLYYIYLRSDGITLKELCELCNEDKSCVSRSVTSLKKDGYIVSENEEGRSYKYLIKLTERGEEIGARICEKIDRALAEIRADLDAEEEMIFYKNLIKISGNMERICSRYDNGDKQ